VALQRLCDICATPIPDEAPLGQLGLTPPKAEAVKAIKHLLAGGDATELKEFQTFRETRKEFCQGCHAWLEGVIADAVAARSASVS
jgi:hypothetical protein